MVAGGNGLLVGRMAKTASYTCQLLQREVSQVSHSPHWCSALLRRSLAILLDSLEIPILSSSFEFLLLILDEILRKLWYAIHKSARIQRRTSPCLSDVALVFDMMGICTRDLETQYDLCHRVNYQTASLDVSTDPTRPREFAGPEKAFRRLVSGKLSPSTEKFNSVHRCSWMVALPPEHTFKASVHYNARVTDPREMREKLVQEGELVERALWRLAGVLQFDDQLEAEYEEESHEPDRGDEVIDIRVESDENEDEEKQEELEQDKEQDTQQEPHANDSEQQPEAQEHQQQQENTINPADKMEIDVDQSQSDLGAPGEEIVGSHESEDTSAQEPTEEMVKKPISLAALIIKPESENEARTKTNAPESSKPRISLRIPISRNADGSARMTVADRVKYDPFGIKTLSKHFDVLEYVEKRHKELQSKTQPTSSVEDLDKSEPGSAANLHTAYLNAFASVTRMKAGSKHSILDMGVINWEADRYE